MGNSSPIPKYSSAIDSSVGGCELSVNCLFLEEDDSSIPSLFPAINYSHEPLNYTPSIYKLTVMNYEARTYKFLRLPDCDKY